MRTDRLLRLFLVGVFAAGLLAAQDNIKPALPPLPIEAVRSADTYRLEVAKVSAQHTEAAKTFPAMYQAKLLDLQNQLQQSGDLEGYLAVAKEVKRFGDAVKGEADPFEKVPEMPDTALVAKPKPLRDLQDWYLKTYKDTTERRRRQIEDLTNAHIGRLETIKQNLTIGKRIRDAIAVMQEVDRLRKGVTDENFVQQALAMLAAMPSLSATNGAETPVVGHVPEWAKWNYDRSGNFAKEGLLFMHPDLPDELTLDFNYKIGRGRVSGRCEVDRMVVDMRERAWFGKAIQWKIKDYATLNATFVLKSREESAGREYGPHAHLALLNDRGGVLALLDVPLWKEATLTVARDQETGRCILGWTQGKEKQSADLPANGGVRLLFGITVRNPGERCDTLFTME